jgi:tetratricopeptide (TPR) repeat protein
VVDLPAAVTRGQAPIEVDLPAVAGAVGPAMPAAQSPFGVDLPDARGTASDRNAPAPYQAPTDWDLPDVGGAGLPARAAAHVSGGFELDLPDLSADLPAATGGSDLPLGPRGAGLPVAAAGLPVATAGLPVAAAGLPIVSGAGLPIGAAGLPTAAAGLPARGAGGPGFGEIDLEPPAGRAPSGAPGGFGEIDLPPAASRPPAAASRASDADPLEADPFGEAPLPPPVSRAPQAASQPPGVESVTRAAGGGTNYGEVSLGESAGASVHLEEPPIRSAAARGEEDMEFGAVPQERAELPPAAMHTKLVAHEPKRRSKAPLRILLGLLVVAVAGGSLAFVPSVGPYGAYWIGDRLNASEHQRLLEASIATARRDMGSDSYPEAKRAFDAFDAAHRSAKRVRAFNTYLAFMAYARELRFGADPALHARAQGLLAELGDANDVKNLDLARAARSVVEDPPERARGIVQALVSSRARDVDALVLSAELELRRRDAQTALAAWNGVAALEKSARASFGLARAQYAAGDAKSSEVSANQALAQHPGHVGAKILIARLGSSSREREVASIRLLEDITKNPGQASQDEVVLAETLLGDIHLARARISLAEAAYGRALKTSPRAARALGGLGESLFRSGRYAEALARFEAGAQADPSEPLLQIGAAKSKLMLERIEEATKLLGALAQSRPDDAAAALWYGRALEASGARDQAAAVYRSAIAKTPVGPDLVDVTIALAVLLSQDGQGEEAQKVLASARERLPESPALRRAIGEVALGQGRHVDAIAEFRRALELDKDDLEARFRLGVALRRNQGYEEAAKVFDEVGAADKDHPGLALERGLLFEATGRSAQALEAYEGALAKAPGDADLMLRVGCGNVHAGRLGPAEELLRKVLSLRQTSAEANHCLGRALLEGGKAADAQRLLERALELDPHRAEYHLYVGWAAIETGNVARADRELAEALKIDSTLADAYWQRGVLRARQGAVRDAVADLTRALQLNPARHEVHAALADAFYDLGRERDALGEWQKAVQGRPDNALWRFRYGKLLVVNQMDDAGRTELLKAIDWAVKQESAPRWLWEAHHLVARSFGARPEAATHWEQFLRLGPRDSPYRTEARQALARLGKPWSGD